MTLITCISFKILLHCLKPMYCICKFEACFLFIGFIFFSFTVIRKKKTMIRVKTRFIMASRPKRKYTSVRELKHVLLEAFYKDIDQEDKDFLGNRFIGEIGNDFYPDDSGSDGRNDVSALVEESDESDMTNERKIMLTREMKMNIPKLLFRFHENKNSKLLMQCLMRKISRKLHLKAILLLNTVILRNRQGNMEISKG